MKTVAEDDMNLPPLPEPTLEDHPYELWGQNVRGNFYTPEQVRQAQREAVAAAVPEGYTEDQIAQAAMEAEIPDSKLESLLIALAAAPGRAALKLNTEAKWPQK